MIFLLCAAIAASGCARSPVVHARGDSDPRIERLVADYTGLWRRETLRPVVLGIEDRGECRFHSLMFSYHG